MIGFASGICHLHQENVQENSHKVQFETVKRLAASQPTPSPVVVDGRSGERCVSMTTAHRGLTRVGLFHGA